jgi:hypothetical protein
MNNNINYVTFADSTESVLDFKEFTENTKDHKFHASRKEWMDKHTTINNQQITCFEKESKNRRPRLRETDDPREYQLKPIKFEPFQCFVEEQGILRFNFIMPPGYNYELIQNKIKDRIGYNSRDYYLSMSGRVLKEDHYFNCTGAPIWIRINLRIFGGSRRIISIKKNCRECGRPAHDTRDGSCPVLEALNNDESSKGKSELSNSNSSNQEYITPRARGYFKKLLYYQAIDTLHAGKRGILADLIKAHPGTLVELTKELNDEEIKFTQETCNYDTSHVSPKTWKDKQKQKVSNFNEKAINTYMNSSANVKDMVERDAFNVKEPPSKLRMDTFVDPVLKKEMCDPRSANQKDELDPFKLLEFEYVLPSDDNFRFYMYREVTIHKGKLPRFACRYLNRTSSMPASPVNLANTLVLLLREDETQEYVRDMTNRDVVIFYEMVISYYSSIQCASATKEQYKILQMCTADRKENNEHHKKDSKFGSGMIFYAAKETLSESIDVLGKQVYNAVTKSNALTKVKSWFKRGKDFILTKRPGDDDDDDPNPNNRMINYGTTRLRECSDQTSSDVDTTEIANEVNKIVGDDSLVLSSEGTITEIAKEVNQLFDSQSSSVIEPLISTSYSKSTDSKVLDWIDLDKSSIFDSPLSEIKKSRDLSSPDSMNSSVLFGRFNTTLTTSCPEKLPSISPVVLTEKQKKNQSKRRNEKEKKKADKLHRDNQILSNVVKLDDGTMSILHSCPIISPLVEEIIKTLIPFGPTIIGAIDDYVHGSTHRKKWHLNSMKYSFFHRLDMHYEHNRHCETSLREHYEYYSNSDEIMPDSLDSEINILSPGATLSSIPLPIINRELRDFYPYDHVNNNNGRLSTKTELVKFYPLLYAINNFVSYGNTNENFVAAVMCRLLYPKTSGPEPGEWKNIIDQIQIFPFDFVPDFESWFLELDNKQKAEVKRHLEAMENGDKICTETKVFLKMKELLKKSAKGYGRLIFNVSTKYLYLLGDFLAQFSNAMVASLFPPIPAYTISKVACFHYASKFNDTNMNDFVNVAMKSACGKFVLVLGDDTMIIDRDSGEFREIDFSAYDSTQVRGGGLDLFPALLRKMGCVKQADDYDAMYAEKINWKQRNGEKLEMPNGWNTSPSRMSGEPGTSVANSYTTIMATKAVLEGTTTYARLGLVAKEKMSKNLDTTFLKGIFLYSTKKDRWFWTRLPSFILKLKSFTEPKTIYKNFSSEKAQQQLLWSQWLGFGNTSTNWFYIEMTKIIRRLCPLASNVELKEDYKVYTEQEFYIEDMEFDTMMYNRYGISREESQNYIDFLSKHAVALPIIYRHSLTDKLIEKDA